MSELDPTSSPPQGVATAGRRRTPAAVLLLGWISLLADVSSEMAYPMVPLLLTGILGAPATVVGLIEGLAEATTAFLSPLAGAASDRWGRAWFVRGGYFLPAVGKLIVALAVSWPILLIGRVIDRSGKGIRTSARDALLVDAADPHRRGHAFGVHRAMEMAGAVVGALIAGAVLFAWGGDSNDAHPIRTVLLVSAGAGLVAFLLSLAVRDARPPRQLVHGHREALPASYWISLVPLALFGLASASDAFILLRAHQLGMPAWTVALAYAAYQASASLSALPIGSLSDRVGRRPVIGAGWLLYALAYAGFATVERAGLLWPLLILYGVAIACTDGAGKALVADRSPESSRGRALGIMNTTVGLAMLCGNLLAGATWDLYGPRAAFALGATSAVLACAALILTWNMTASTRRHA